MIRAFFTLIVCAFTLNAYSACELYNLTITRSDCDKDKKFYLTFDFQYKDVGECFTIKGNGKNYGSFKYHNLPVTIGPFTGDCKTQYEFLIQDCKHSTCKIVTHYDKVCCETPCELSDMYVEKLHCDAEGTFCVSINFKKTGHSTCFKLTGNGKNYGKFSYSQLPLKICGLKGDCETEYEFTATDCEHHECTVSETLGIVCCEKACKLSDLKIEKTDCDKDGNFYVHINFKYSDASDCFKVSGNGKDYGSFKYTQLPIKLGPFKGDCKTVYEFKIKDCKDEHCTLSKELGKVCCDKKECSIKDLKIEKTDCDKTNHFYVFINFKYSNTSPCFIIKGNGINYGTFDYTQLPVKLGPFKGDCKKHYEFIVIDCENEHCKASKSIGKICCDHKKDDNEEILRKADSGIQTLEAEAWNPAYQRQDLISSIQQSSDRIAIRLNRQIEYETEIRLYTIQGLLIQKYRTSGNENSIEINSEDLTPGLYFIRIEDKVSKRMIKFMKF